MRLILTILFSGGLLLASAQENIYASGPTTRTNFYNAVRIGDTVYLSLAQVNLAGGSPQEASQFLKLDWDGNLFSRRFYPHPDTTNDWVLGLLGTSQDKRYLYRDVAEPEFKTYDSLNQAQFVERIRVNTGKKTLFPLQPDSTVKNHFAYDLQERGDSLFLAGSYSLPSTGFKPFWAVFDSTGQLAHYRDTGYTYRVPTFNKVEFFEDQVIFITRNSKYGLKMEVRNLPDLSLYKEVYARQTYPPGQEDNYVHTLLEVLPQGQNNLPMGLGLYQNGNVGLIKYADDWSIASVDSFPIVTDSLKNEMYTFLKPFGYRSADSIFCVATYDNYKRGFLSNVGKTGGMQILQFDTAGNVHWRKRIHKDSVIYFSKQILPTPDGGALIFSEVVDPDYSLQPHSRLSVIKIQGDGRILNESFYDLPQQRKVSVYPNPAEDKIQLKGISLKAGQETPYRIYGLDGTVRDKGRYQSGKEISLRSLAPGHYLLRIRDKRGAWHTARFVKK
jgi:hypothetical protein